MPENMDSLYLTSRGIADFDLFPYVPSAGAGWTFVVFFGLAAITHFILATIHKSWYFTPFVLGCIGEVPRCKVSEPIRFS